MNILNSTLLPISRTLLSFLLFNSLGCIENNHIDLRYEKEVEDFRKRRVKFLKSEKGYLNLVGLFWLNEGKNSFGSGKTNDFQFPEAFPKNFGFATKSGKSLTFNYIDPVILNNDINVISTTINIDDRSQVFSFGPFRWFIIKSGEHYAIRMRNLESPKLNEDLQLKFYEIDKSWRIIGRFTPYENQKSRVVSNIRNIDYEQRTPGIINFTQGDQLFAIEPTLTREGMEVIFTDETTGGETFSGGRFLLLKEPEKNGDIILDFNKALNFPCAINDYTTCPIPPQINHLTMMVSAGEKTYFNKKLMN